MTEEFSYGPAIDFDSILRFGNNGYNPYGYGSY